MKYFSNIKEQPMTFFKDILKAQSMKYFEMI